jgi:hypothetical protein
LLCGTLKVSEGLWAMALSNSVLVAAGGSDVALWSLDTLSLIRTFEHEAAESYTGYSIWVRVYLALIFALLINVQDTYRAAWAWLILMAPENVPGMITSMLADYKEVCICILIRSPACY